MIIWLDQLKKRRASGEADEEEAWPLTNLEHTVLMYDMMMNRVLENLDPVSGAPPDDAKGDPTDLELKQLVDRIDESLEQSTEDILKTLRHAVHRGYLRLAEKEDCRHWEWVDFLTIEEGSVLKVLVFQQNGSGESKIAGIRKYGDDRFDIKMISIDIALPPVIDDAREFLPEDIDADLVLDFLQHPDLSYDLGQLCSRKGIPVVASGKKVKIEGVATPPT